MDKELSLEKLKEELSQDDEWFDNCKSAIKSIKPARHALKALHQAGNNTKVVKKILPELGSAIKKICDSKADSDERKTWKNALWRFVAQFSEMKAEQLVRIHDSYIQSKQGDKSKLSDKGKHRKDLTHKRPTPDHRTRIEGERKKKYNQQEKHRRTGSPLVKDDRKRKFDKDKPPDYGKKWRQDTSSRTASF